MFVPGMQQGVRLPPQHQRLPRRLLPLCLGIGAVAGVLVTWAAFSARPASDGGESAGFIPLQSPRLDALLLLQPGAGGDDLIVKPPAGSAPERTVARFPSTFSLHARGEASPDGASAAVLWVGGALASGQLSIVTIASGHRVEAQGEFEYLSSLAWSRDSSKVAGVAAAVPDASGRIDATVVEVDAGTGAVTDVTRFDAVLGAHPVGYSLDGERLFVVTIDASGSALWAISGGRGQRVGQLSAGRTQDWSLSPDGGRLAFVDVAGAGAERTFAGAVMRIATGVVTSEPARGAQLGAAWRPGAESPTFGGPGGSVGLEGGSAADSYVVPAAWSQDGDAVVASVYSPESVRASLELVTPTGRIPLAEARGASFLGWVTNPD